MNRAKLYIQGDGAFGASCGDVTDTGHRIEEDSGMFTVWSVHDKDNVICLGVSRKHAEAAITLDWLGDAVAWTGNEDVRTLAYMALSEGHTAMERFPQPNYVISKVAEEAGEVVKAAIHCAEGREDKSAVRNEIVQAMAMLMRLYIEGDHVHGLTSLRSDSE